MKFESVLVAFLRGTIIAAFLVPATMFGSGAQSEARLREKIPRFEDYVTTEEFQGAPAALRFPRFAAESIRGKLRGYMKGKPNLGGHYEFVTWGCGTNCTAGAIVDLQTGVVYSPPLTERTKWLPEYQGWGICAQSWDGTWETRSNSRLVVVSCGWNYDAKGKNWPDVYYLLWQGNRFTELLHVRPPKRWKPAGGS